MKQQLNIDFKRKLKNGNWVYWEMNYLFPFLKHRFSGYCNYRVKNCDKYSKFGQQSNILPN